MYKEIAEKLSAAIYAGQFGEKLPTEKELMKLYDCGRNTLRKAIDLLSQWGVIVRVQGSGYFVRTQPSTARHITNLSIKNGLSNDMSGHKVTSKLVSQSIVKARDIPGLAGRHISSDDEFNEVTRLRFLDDDLYSLEISYFKRALVPLIPDAMAQTSLFNFIRQTYDVYVVASDEYIAIEPLGDSDADLMRLPSGDQVMALHEYNYYRNNVLFNYSISYFAMKDLTLFFHTSDQIG